LIDLARLSFENGLRPASSSAQDALKHFENVKSLAEKALTITERCGYFLQGADVNLILAVLALTPTPLPNSGEGQGERAKETAILHAKEALRFAHCDDGPPYHYKVA
jgi:hypothetical protein